MPEARKAGSKKLKVPAKAWCIYVLCCVDGSFYCGVTNDLERRVRQHNAGTGARYTRVRLPVTLEGSWFVDSRSEALKGELAFKKFSRKNKEHFLASLGKDTLTTN